MPRQRRLFQRHLQITQLDYLYQGRSRRTAPLHFGQVTKNRAFAMAGFAQVRKSDAGLMGKWTNGRRVRAARGPKKYSAQISGRVRLYGNEPPRWVGAKEDVEMRFGKAIALAAASLAMTGAAHAWSSDGNGNIRCSDGSSATATKQTNGTWNVTAAGAKGTTGSGYATEGKAALAACGEG
jgi:hypothetical protein